MAEQLRKLAELLERAQHELGQTKTAKCAHILKAARGLELLKRKLDSGAM